MFNLKNNFNNFQILVLDAGRLIEFDHPYILLQNKKGHFRQMVAETGPSMAPILHKLAAEVYKSVHVFILYLQDILNAIGIIPLIKNRFQVSPHRNSLLFHIIVLHSGTNL